MYSLYIFIYPFVCINEYFQLPTSYGTQTQSAVDKWNMKLKMLVEVVNTLYIVFIRCTKRMSMRGNVTDFLFIIKKFLIGLKFFVINIIILKRLCKSMVTILTLHFIFSFIFSLRWLSVFHKVGYNKLHFPYTIMKSASYLHVIYCVLYNSLCTSTDEPL